MNPSPCVFWPTPPCVIPLSLPPSLTCSLRPAPPWRVVAGLAPWHGRCCAVHWIHLIPCDLTRGFSGVSGWVWSKSFGFMASLPQNELLSKSKPFTSFGSQYNFPAISQIPLHFCAEGVGIESPSQQVIHPRPSADLGVSREDLRWIGWVGQ